MLRYNILKNQEAAEKFIQGVINLKDPALSPWPGQNGLSMYDFFVFWHHRAMMLNTPPSQSDRNAAHSGPVFLPWHRYMLTMFEGFLQDVINDPDFRLPYWDWSEDAETLSDPTASLIWSNELLGQFTSSPWEVRLAPNPFGNNIAMANRGLRRNLGARGTLPEKSTVKGFLQEDLVYDEPPFNSDSGEFRNLLEGWEGIHRFHNVVHVWIGEDMTVSTSPNDPAFYLHHCFVDKIWSSWQTIHSDKPYLPDSNAPDELAFHRLGDEMHTFFNERVTVGDFLDHNARYLYDTLDDLITEPGMA